MVGDLMKIAGLLLLVAAAGVRDRAQIDGHGEYPRIHRLATTLFGRKRPHKQVACVQVVVEALLVLQFLQEAKQIDCYLGDGRRGQTGGIGDESVELLAIHVLKHGDVTRRSSASPAKRTSASNASRIPTRCCVPAATSA